MVAMRTWWRIFWLVLSILLIITVPVLIWVFYGWSYLIGGIVELVPTVEMALWLFLMFLLGFAFSFGLHYRFPFYRGFWIEMKR
jgi:hypothetical protein